MVNQLWLITCRSRNSLEINYGPISEASSVFPVLCVAENGLQPLGDLAGPNVHGQETLQEVGHMTVHVHAFVSFSFKGINFIIIIIIANDSHDELLIPWCVCNGPEMSWLTLVQESANGSDLGWGHGLLLIWQPERWLTS